MIKVIGERDKVSFLAIFGCQIIPLPKGDSLAVEIEEGDKLLIVQEEIFEEVSEVVKKRKLTFPIVFPLSREKEEGLLEKFLWK